MGIQGEIFGILPSTMKAVGIWGHLMLVQTWLDGKKTLGRNFKEVTKGKFGGERNLDQKDPKTTSTCFMFPKVLRCHKYLFFFNYIIFLT